MLDANRQSAEERLAHAPPVSARLRRVALIGTYPPRRCGIATFTADLKSALDGADAAVSFDVLPISERGETDPARDQLPQDCLGAYVAAARRLNAAGTDLVCIQHEFGIFGGPSGSHILALVRELRCPVVTTFHTVLENPTQDQRRVTEALVALCARVVVMSRKGRDILMRVYNAPARKIAIIPHGAPDRPRTRSAVMKERLGLAGRDVILTFGLLSPGKGLETMIRALPRIVAARPDTLYVIVGATHPHLVAREGEAYRERLTAIAAELGVTGNVRFVNKYVDTDELVDYLTAADVYATPYLNPAQITSGTLAYAVALGKAVVSTPYWHAEELLSGGVGVLTPFGDFDAMGRAVLDLLCNEDAREALSRRAHRKGRETIWSAVGVRYMELFETVRREGRTRVRPAVTPPAISFRAVERMTDDVGILQHARFSAPDRNHGYCIDDNARALLLTQRANAAGVRSPSLDRLAHAYAGFVEYAWNADAGRFRNFMGYGRNWLEAVGSEDSCGRGFWSLGETVLLSRDVELKGWAANLAGRVAPHMPALQALRATAFAALGFCGLIAAGDQSHRHALRAAAEKLHAAYLDARRPDWDWFEPWLAYDNARLPEIMLRAGAMLDDDAMIDCGLRTLGWLTAVHTAPSGAFRPVGSEGMGRRYVAPVQFDQQPLEAAAAIDACWAAFDATGDRTWRDEAQRAFAWYMGDNDLGISLAQDGGCYDGLRPNGPNRNQGAESILSLQLAITAMRVREANKRPEPKPTLTTIPLADTGRRALIS